MKTRFTHRFLAGAGIIACTAAVLNAGVASAQTDAINSFTGGQAQTNQNFTLGYTFSLTAPVLVTDLGYFDYQANGLAEAHTVGIYNAAGTLLFSSAVPAGTVGTLGTTFATNNLINGQNASSGFRYTSVGAPQALATGNYTIAAFSGTTGQDILVAVATTVNTSSPVVFGTGVANASGGGLSATAPTGFVAPNSYFGPSFRFNPTVAAPEPGTFALLGTGLLSMGSVTLRRRSKKAAK